MSNVAAANAAFRNADYVLALHNYQIAAKLLGEKCFSANIAICKSRLKEKTGSSQIVVNKFKTKEENLTQEATKKTINVNPGDIVRVNITTKYSKSTQDKIKRAVLLVQYLDIDNKPISPEKSKLSKSKSLNGYYLYLPCTQGKECTVAHIEVPIHVSSLSIKPEVFNINPGDSVSFSNLRLDVIENSAVPSVFEPPSRLASDISILGWPEYPDKEKPYIIGIMDEFTTGCFENDLNLIQPRPDNWYALAEKYKPAVFFIESAWKGNGGSWQYRVADYANKPGNEIAHITQYARQKGIPTVFWNKEDPVHHEKFMCSAKLVDHVFTTDANMCSSYREKTGNPNAYALPFAAQPALHKPAPLVGRRPLSCFAGSWYGNRHELRGQAMRFLLDAGNRYGMDIYDRNFGTGNFVFPDEYQKGIKGSLPYKELCDEYSRYRLFLNVNSVTDSPTMFSRRVFELLACGTPVVSTYARGIEELFESKAVWLVNSAKEADNAIRTLMTDDAEWRRRSLAGIREVFAQHTYAHRLNSMFESIGLDTRLRVDPPVLLVAKAGNNAELQTLLSIAATQNYPKWRLLIECGGSAAVHSDVALPNVKLVAAGYLSSAALEAEADNYMAIGWIAPESTYGEGYLRDLANATSYQPEALGWAKSIGLDMFAFDQPAALSGAIWQPAHFLKNWRNADARQPVQSSQLFIIDGAEYSSASAKSADWKVGK